MILALEVLINGQIEIDFVALDLPERCREWEEVPDDAAAAGRVRRNRIGHVKRCFDLLVDGDGGDGAVPVEENLVVADEALAGIVTVVVVDEPFLGLVSTPIVIEGPLVVSHEFEGNGLCPQAGDAVGAFPGACNEPLSFRFLAVGLGLVLLDTNRFV